jgi:hypothetical protein
MASAPETVLIQHIRYLKQGIIMFDITKHELESLIIDLTDGSLTSWRDIQEHTGLSEERCKEMEVLVQKVFNKYFNRTVFHKVS